MGGTLQLPFDQPHDSSGVEPGSNPLGTLLTSGSLAADIAASLPDGVFVSAVSPTVDRSLPGAAQFTEMTGGFSSVPFLSQPGPEGTLQQPGWKSGDEASPPVGSKPGASPGFTLLCSHGGLLAEKRFSAGATDSPLEDKPESPNLSVSPLSSQRGEAFDARPQDQFPAGTSRALPLDAPPSNLPGNTLALPWSDFDAPSQLPVASGRPIPGTSRDLGGTIFCGPSGITAWTGPTAEPGYSPLRSNPDRLDTFSDQSAADESFQSPRPAETVNTAEGGSSPRASTSGRGPTPAVHGALHPASPRPPVSTPIDSRLPSGGPVEPAPALTEKGNATPAPLPSPTTGGLDTARPLSQLHRVVPPDAPPTSSPPTATPTPGSPSFSNEVANPPLPQVPTTLPAESDLPESPPDTPHETLQTHRYPLSPEEREDFELPGEPRSESTAIMPPPEPSQESAGRTQVASDNRPPSPTEPAPGSDETDQQSTSGPTGTPIGTRPLLSSRSLGEPLKSTPGVPVSLDYQILERLGFGGMGIVFRARQSSLIREVAVKVMKRALAADPHQRSLFLDEAILTASLEHPNIVPMHELACDTEGQLFCVMKVIEGTHWNKVIGQDPERDLQILIAVTNAIAFAHSRGIVHRDLKPENIMLGEFGEVQVVDWGLALATSEYRNRYSLSSAPSRGYTPAYAAPELMSGSRREIGPWSDIYLLGAMLFHIQAGVPPHPGKTLQSCCAAVERNEIVATDRTGELLDIALKAMSTKPADRHSSVQEFQEDLQLYLRHRESRRVADTAQAALEHARQSDSYDDYSRALHGFEQALQMWEGNVAAREQLRHTRLDYAAAALRREDLDQGLSLLQAEEPSHQPLRAQLLEAREYRAQRSHRERRLKSNLLRLGIATVIVSLGAATYSYIQKVDADRATTSAKEARDDEKRAKENAENRRQDAEAAKIAAEKAQLSEAAEKRNAVASAKEAVEQSQRAETNRERAEYQAYVASIGKAQAAVDLNDFYSAQAALHTVSFAPLPRSDEAPSRTQESAAPGTSSVVHPGWEWQRLRYLLTQSRQVMYGPSDRAGTPLGACALHPQGTSLILGDADSAGTLRWLPLTLPSGVDPIAPVTSATQVDRLGSAVTRARWSDDGTWLAVGTQRGEIRVWHHDLNSTAAPVGQGCRLPDSLGLPVQDLAFVRVQTPNPALLLLVAQGNQILIWQIDESSQENHRQVSRSNKASQDPFTLRSLSVLQDPNLLITAGDSRRADVWKVVADIPPASLSGSPDKTNAPAWTLQHHRNNGEMASIKPGTATLVASAVGPTGRVATAGSDGSIAIWDPQQVREQLIGQQPNLLSSFKTASPARAVQFDPSGTSLIVCLEDSTIEIWTVGSSSPTRSVSLRGHLNPPLFASFPARNTQAQDTWLVSASGDGRVILWNTKSYFESALQSLDTVKPAEGRPFITLQPSTGPRDPILDDVFSLDLDPQGKFVVAATRGRSARLWPLTHAGTTLRSQPPVLLEEAVESPLIDARWIPDKDNSLIATIDQLGCVSLWNTVTSTRVAQIPAPPTAGTTSAKTAPASQPLSQQIPRMAVSSDGKRLAVADEIRGLSIYRVDDLLTPPQARQTPPAVEMQVSLAGINEGLRWIGFLPGLPDQLCATDSQKTIWKWSLNTPQAAPQPLPEPPSTINTVLGLPQGRLAVATDDGQVFLYSVNDNANPARLDTQSWGVDHLRSLDNELWCVARQPVDPKEPSRDFRFELQQWDLMTRKLRSTISIGAILSNQRLDQPSGPTDERVARRVIAFEVLRQNDRQSAIVLVDLGNNHSALWEADLSNSSEITWNEVQSSDPSGQRMADSHRNAIIHNLAVSPDGTQAVTVGGIEARVWNRKPLLPWTSTVRLGNHSAVTSVAIAADSEHVLTGSWDQTFKLWKIEKTGNLPTHAQGLQRVLVPEDGTISHVVFFRHALEQQQNANSLWFATAHQSGKVKIWKYPDTNNFAEPQWESPPEQEGRLPVGALAVSAEGNKLAFSRGVKLFLVHFPVARDTAGNWKQVTAVREVDQLDHIFGGTGGESPKTSPGGKTFGPITSLAFSKDGRILAVATSDRQIGLLRPETQTALLTKPLVGHSQPIRSLVFSQQADRLVSVGDDGTARVWNIREHKSIDESASRELLILRRPTFLDAASGDPLQSAVRGAGRNGGLKAVVFLPGDRALVAAGTSKSGAEHQLIVWPAESSESGPLPDGPKATETQTTSSNTEP